MAEATLPAKGVTAGGRHRKPEDVLADGTTQWIHYGTIATHIVCTKGGGPVVEPLGDDGCDQQFGQLFQPVRTAAGPIPNPSAKHREGGPLLLTTTTTGYGRRFLHLQ